MKGVAEGVGLAVGLVVTSLIIGALFTWIPTLKVGSSPATLVLGG